MFPRFGGGGGFFFFRFFLFLLCCSLCSLLACLLACFLWLLVERKKKQRGLFGLASFSTNCGKTRHGRHRHSPTVRNVLELRASAGPIGITVISTIASTTQNDRLGPALLSQMTHPVGVSQVGSSSKILSIVVGVLVSLFWFRLVSPSRLA